MTVEEAKEYANNMTYTEAVYNALQGRAVPYKKATKIKLDELLEKAKALENQNTIIDELEKIKTELISCFSQENDIDSDPYNHALDIAISIIHDHIIELKGE